MTTRPTDWWTAALVLAGGLVTLGTAHAADPAARMVSPAEGVALRLSDITVAPHKPTLPADLESPRPVYWGLFKVCVSPTGEVANVTVVRGTGETRVDASWMEAIKTWRYKPHAPAGTAVPFCHPTRLQIGQAPEAPAGAGTDAAQTLPPAIAGAHLLTDVTQAPHKPTLPKELNKAGMVVWGLYRVCVDTAGQVNDVRVLRGTDHPALDDSWIGKIRTWRYRPYTVSGKAVPFCSPLRLQVAAR